MTIEDLTCALLSCITIDLLEPTEPDSNSGPKTPYRLTVPVQGIELPPLGGIDRNPEMPPYVGPDGPVQDATRMDTATAGLGVSGLGAIGLAGGGF
jgi:hypothetical protein